MNKDLVDDDLKEKRRQKRKDLDKEGADQDLSQRLAILPNGVDKPSDPEPAVGVS